MPVPAGMRRPTITFSLRPRRWSTRPEMLASVSTRVVSWNEAAEMKLSVDSDALVMPRRRGVPSAGSPPRFITFSFSSMKRKRSTCSSTRKSVSPTRATRDLGQDVARVDLVAVLHHDVGAGGKQVALLLALLRFDGDGRRALLGGGRLDDDHLREAGDAVGFFADVLAFDDVLERHLSADLGENGRGERIPFHERLAGVDVLSVVHLQRGAVDERVTLLLAAGRVERGGFALLRLLDRGVVHDQQLAVTVDDDEIAVLVRDGGDVDELHFSGVGCFVLRLLGNA